MRSRYLIFASSAFLASVCMVMFQKAGDLEQSTKEPQDKAGTKARKVRSLASLPRNERPESVDTPERTKSTGSSDRAGKPRHGNGSKTSGISNEHPAHSGEFSSLGLASRPIQLSESTRLPAVLLPSRGLDGAHVIPMTMPHPVQAAIKEITDDFYRDLGSRISEPPEGEASEVSESKETDVALIEPGQDADEARHIADERFRAMFGNATYNRHALDSVIEVGLPRSTGSGSN